MRILVTGTTGFIGGRLLERLAALGGHEIFSLQLPADGRDGTSAAYGAKTLLADLSDPLAVKNAVEKSQPDAVFHLAAVSAVSYGYDHPHEVLATNLTGTVNLAESCLREVPGFRHFLFASTSAVYGNGPVPKREDTAQAPNNPYAVSKLAAEKYLLYMREAYRFPVTILRPFNTYGRRDSSSFFVESTVAQMLAGREVKLGDPTPVRDWLYVDDHVDAYLACFAQPERCIGECLNVCTNQPLAVRDLAEKLREMTGFTGQILWDTVPRRPIDIQVLYGDASKAQSLLGWTPKISLEEGLRRTVDFWRSKLAGASELAARP